MVLGISGGKTTKFKDKKPKKEERELDDDDLEFKKKQQEQAAKLKEMQKLASQKGPLKTSSGKK